MGFKLQSDSFMDRPVILCDVCDQPLADIFSDKATGTPTTNQFNVVTVHHATCVPPAGSVTIPLIQFLRLLVVQNRIGDLASDGGIDKVGVEYPTGKGFEV